ncbi:MAG: hypothetical protein ACJ735_03820 [Actinomycetes bacterium]
MNADITTSYVARVCDVPPLVARAGLEELARTQPVLLGAGWELRFDDATSAVLTTRWPCRASVHVEVERWSRSRVLLGLRHRSRAVPWWSELYFASAHEAASAITQFLTEWADRPLREIVDPADGGQVGSGPDTRVPRPYRRSPIF